MDSGWWKEMVCVLRPSLWPCFQPPMSWQKIQKALVKHWRKQGIRTFTYLDNGAGTKTSLEIARAASRRIREDIAASCSVTHPEKCCSAWQKWAEAREINVLPTSGPELACYLVHLLQTTKSLASIQAAAFGVAWVLQKAWFPLSLQHTTLKQLLKACKRILGSCPKTEKPHSQQARSRNWCSSLVGEVLVSFRVCLIALGFTALICCDDLKGPRRYDLHTSNDHMSIMLTKMKNKRFLSSWRLVQALVHALYPWPRDLFWST